MAHATPKWNYCDNYNYYLYFCFTTNSGTRYFPAQLTRPHIEFINQDVQDSLAQYYTCSSKYIMGSAPACIVNASELIPACVFYCSKIFQGTTLDPRFARAPSTLHWPSLISCTSMAYQSMQCQQQKICRQPYIRFNLSQSKIYSYTPIRLLKPRYEKSDGCEHRP